MQTLGKLLLPIALVLGACSSDEADAPAASGSDTVRRESRPLERFAELDADGDGALTPGELEGHELSVLFAELDADGDDRLSSGELIAAKRAHDESKRGKHRRGRGGNAPALAPN